MLFLLFSLLFNDTLTIIAKIICLSSLIVQPFHIINLKIMYFCTDQENDAWQ